MADTPSPVWKQFGDEFRKQRLRAKVSQAECAKACLVVRSQISHIQRGTRRPSEAHVAKLDNLLGTDGKLARLWHTLSRQEGNGDWFADSVMLEQQAVEIRDYQSHLIPGLIQIEDYARSVLMSAQRWADHGEDLEKRVHARMERKKIMRDNGRGKPLLWFLIGEYAVRRIIGSQQVMIDQLEHVADLAQSGAINLQMVTNDSQAHCGMIGGFRTMAFIEQPPMAFADHAVGETCLEEERDVRRCNLIYGTLQADALSSTDTLTELRKQIDHYGQQTES